MKLNNEIELVKMKKITNDLLAMLTELASKNDMTIYELFQNYEITKDVVGHTVDSCIVVGLNKKEV